ncbi:MAG TPA: DnaJ domain-containing protein, partial [Chloroflexia bacterium]|nr:DnaJ domain-containing protein [Chloroflexia bacterium]
MNTLPEQNPYYVLQVPRDASIDEIEDAYDALYDLHEPGARAGDEREIAFLTGLNEAREVLLDPQRRSHLDQKLHERTRRPAKAPAPRTSPYPRPQEKSSARPAHPSPGAMAPITGTVPAKVRRRSGPR